MPDTALEIVFQWDGPTIPRKDVQRVTVAGIQSLEAHIHDHSDGSIQDSLRWKSGMAKLMIDPGLGPAPPLMTYSSTMLALKVMAMKMSREGYYERVGTVRRIGDDRLVGHILIVRPQNMEAY